MAIKFIQHPHFTPRTSSLRVVVCLGSTGIAVCISQRTSHCTNSTHKATHNAMSNAGAIASISNRLTSAQSQLLERSRILGLGMKPSPSSTQSLVRTLTQVRNDLAKLEGEAELEAAGLAVGGAGKKRSNSSGGDLAAIEELGSRYDRLVEMLQADEVGREKAKPLVRERR